MKIKGKISNWRVIVMYLCVLFVSSSVVAKILKVHLDPPINTNSQPRFEPVEAPRGNILTDDGSILAISMPFTAQLTTATPTQT